ncbi:MAG: helix-turn-helix domain-containing protein [Bauldia sp.]
MDWTVAYTDAYIGPMDIGRLLQELLEAKSWSQEELAARLHTTQANVSRWLKGREPRASQIEAIRDLASELGLLAEAPSRRQIIPIMGYVGAGGDVDPDFEQVPPDGLDQVEIPYIVGIVGDPIGFEVRGESNQPKYSAGEVVIVEREQPTSIDSMIGDFAVVVTETGKRYLKKIMAGRKAGTFDLVSINAPTMEGVRLKWASPVRIQISNIGLRRLGAIQRRAPPKK